MISPLDRKLLRDLGRMKGQVIAVSLVMACGLAMMIMTRSLILTLESTRDAYYEQFALADVFASLKRAPLSAAAELEKLPGVSVVEPRVAVDVTLDLPGLAEPATGHVISLPEDGGAPKLNRIFLRTGRMPEIDSRREVVVGEAFATENGLKPGDSLVAVINGHRETLQICGIGLSPEFVFEARAGETLPDHKRFSVIWMNYRALAVAYNLDGAFNDVCIDLAPGAVSEPVMEAMDRILAPYGAGGAYTRKDQASAQRLGDELKVLHALSVVYPLVFLSVAAFMVNSVLSRIVRLQREQIAQMKALGYSSRQVGVHYLKFVVVIGFLGTVIGGLAGRWMGGGLVNLYTMFFRFPSLEFRMDYGALLTALLVSAGASAAGVITVVWQAVKLPPAEAMRPEPPADFKPSLFERIGLTRFFSPVFRMALRNIERRPWQAVFTSAGIALATGLMVLPGAMENSIDYLLTFQWNRQQRQDVAVFLVEPSSEKGLHDLEHLPGVTLAEPIRSVQTRLRYGHHHRKLAITGLPPGANLNRLLDEQGETITMPEEGLIMSKKLAEVIGANIGDEVQVEVMEGRRPILSIPIRGLVTDYAGVAAYMDIAALRRLMHEGDTVNGAYLTLDHSRWDDFMREVKDTPRAAIVMVKRDQLASFRETTAKSIGLMRTLYFVLAVIVAFGVVYNSSRIALSERSRELATLRVVGFNMSEVRGVLLGELSLLVLSAIPVGLALGKGLVLLIMSSFSTETVRMPIVVESSTYSIAVLVVLSAAAFSFTLVSRMLGKLDLVGVLKARD
ncbi:FtsX-like permease family protein [Luteolibacter ambystomatis]|uniref:FtsX-like permease family protein n=1 Tax=Luteolibacter ambystomatis TaxID=2824561 RepID=A0A975G8L7_9BACT|nr:FtsX-like permease family protein [Luteolibacter ambystomatis]QUE50813.1 FtsX-like permease family protein [Luteolibacter ambystomatis]